MVQNGGALTPSAASAGSGCTNTPPSSDYSCAQQVSIASCLYLWQ